MYVKLIEQVTNQGVLIMKCFRSVSSFECMRE